MALNSKRNEKPRRLFSVSKGRVAIHDELFPEPPTLSFLATHLGEFNLLDPKRLDQVVNALCANEKACLIAKQNRPALDVGDAASDKARNALREYFEILVNGIQAVQSNRSFLTKLKSVSKDREMNSQIDALLLRKPDLTNQKEIEAFLDSVILFKKQNQIKLNALLDAKMTDFLSEDLHRYPLFIQNKRGQFLWSEVNARTLYDQLVSLCTLIAADNALLMALLEYAVEALFARQFTGLAARDQVALLGAMRWQVERMQQVSPIDTTLQHAYGTGLLAAMVKKYSVLYSPLYQLDGRSKFGIKRQIANMPRYAQFLDMERSERSANEQNPLRLEARLKVQSSQLADCLSAQHTSVQGYQAKLGERKNLSSEDLPDDMLALVRGWRAFTYRRFVRRSDAMKQLDRAVAVYLDLRDAGGAAANLELAVLNLQGAITNWYAYHAQAKTTSRREPWVAALQSQLQIAHPTYFVPPPQVKPKNTAQGAKRIRFIDEFFGDTIDIGAIVQRSDWIARSRGNTVFAV